MYSADLLRWARLHVGLSQQALAGKTGVAQSTISRIEAGDFDPRFSTLRILLRGCGYDFELIPARGYGVDRTQIRQQLGLTPTQRARAIAQFSNAMREFDRLVQPRGQVDAKRKDSEATAE
jgi:transcriptional regulator with XRE-family HTH domain